MIITILSLALLVVFTSLGLIHIYWLFGGKWAVEKVIPTKVDDEKVASPPMIATAMVGLGLISFGVFYLLKSGLIYFQIPSWILSYSGWIIPAIFIVRAIGDFNYIGFFKKVKYTTFGKYDTKVFSPLCLAIGIVGVIIQLA